jgi:hypothetical protein
MTRPWLLLPALASFLPAGSMHAQALKPKSTKEYECYVRSAEDRVGRRTSFLIADADPALLRSVTQGRNVQTVPGNGTNPHKITGAMVYDWVGTVFVPGEKVDRAVRMLQDYDHRARYFPEIISTSKLLCRSGETRFGFSMRLKEPAVIDSDNDVVWEKVDAHRWRCRSYSTKIAEIGKQHGYLFRLNSYWRFAETDKGLWIEGQTITLSGEFGSFMRTLGSLAGINPEKSLKKTLSSMRDTLEKRSLEFPAPPSGMPDCGEAVPQPVCTLQSMK